MEGIPTSPTPGRLIAIGGAEDKTRERVILRCFVESARAVAGGGEADLIVLATASEVPETGARYAAHFTDTGIFLFEFCQLPQQIVTRLLNMFKHLLPLQELQQLEGHGTRQRAPAKSCPMQSGVNAGSHAIRREQLFHLRRTPRRLRRGSRARRTPTSTRGTRLRVRRPDPCAIPTPR